MDRPCWSPSASTQHIDDPIRREYCRTQPRTTISMSRTAGPCETDRVISRAPSPLEMPSPEGGDSPGFVVATHTVFLNIQKHSPLEMPSPEGGTVRASLPPLPPVLNIQETLRRWRTVRPGAASSGTT
jgi:hypothetical protein